MFISTSRRLLTLVYPKLSPYLLFRPLEKNTRILSQRDHFTGYKYSPKRSNLKETSPGSRYVPPSRHELAEECILSALSNKIFLNEDEWDDFKSSLFESIDYITEESFGVIVMSALETSNQLDLSHNFLKYLEQSTMRPNLLTYLKYIAICGRNYSIVDQKLILSVIDKVKAQIDESPVLDMKRAGYIILGLCATDRWRESFKYLRKVTKSKPNNDICNTLACAAIRNGDEELAWEILMKWVNSYETVCNKVIEEFLLVALKMQKSKSVISDKFILKLFNYIQAQNIIISLNAAKLIEQYFKSHHQKWNITYTKVSRKGICSTCEHFLKPCHLENEEFKTLCDAFLKRAVMKSDLFINTSTKEFENYMKFIDFHKPFHMVLDGLNAAHSYVGSPNKKSLSSQLFKIVKILSGKSRKLLVLGKKHMQYWPKYEMMKISHNAKLFFTDNISQDDPFVIYSALVSGPHTLFLSDDLMRDHISRLEEPKLIHLFKKWQRSHQVFLQCDENDIKFIEPVRHTIELQGCMEYGWHIPFDDKIILDPYEELNNWLCIKKVR